MTARPAFQDASFGADAELGAEAAVRSFMPGIGAIEDPELANVKAVHRRRLLIEQDLQRFGDHSRQAEAVRSAFRNGMDDGFRRGYISGMHWGMGTGAIAGALLTCLLIGAGVFVWPSLAAALP